MPHTLHICTLQWADTQCGVSVGIVYALTVMPRMWHCLQLRLTFHTLPPLIKVWKVYKHYTEAWSEEVITEKHPAFKNILELCVW